MKNIFVHDCVWRVNRAKKLHLTVYGILSVSMSNVHCTYSVCTLDMDNKEIRFQILYSFFILCNIIQFWRYVIWKQINGIDIANPK